MTEHAAKKIITRESRGVSYKKVKDVFRNGIKYWNPSQQQYVMVK